MKALLSVYNKEGIVDFAKELTGLGWDILASGGTAKALTDAGIKVQDVASLVGGGPILGHRVVTLSREIHAGLLSTDSPADTAELAKLNIPRIDLVCVDLYPLKEEIAKLNLGAAPAGRASPSEAGRESVIEKTDIGGPTMLRSAAKGGRIVICDPSDRMKVIAWLKANKPDEKNFINNLCAKSEAVIADYVLTSARYHSQGLYEGEVGWQTLSCLYGENAWQNPAGLFSTDNNDPLSISKFQLISGTSPSYNNICDLERLLQTATHIAGAFDLNMKKVPLIAVGVKHGNPCGASVGENAKTVLKNMLEGDLRAIFGGVVMTNFPIDKAHAETLLTHKMVTSRRLLDGIIAPSFTADAVELLKRKGDKCRFLANPALATLNKNSLDTSTRLRHVRGGFLKQPNYTFILELEKPNADMLLAWAIGSTSNSNTVTIVKNGKLLGNGVGQQDRVGCCELALKRAKDAGNDVKGAVAYSDSFFPFIDGPTTLINAGITGILATSGSVRDEEVKKLCAEKGVSLVLIPDKLARGFFGH